MKRYPLIAAGCLVGMLIPASANATPANSPAATPSASGITIAAPDLVRVDRQDPPSAVTFAGASTLTRLRVDWGDGSAPSTARGTCSAVKAHRTPGACKVTTSHTFATAGAFTIRATSGTRTATHATTVAEIPQRWQKTSGWVQPAGWETLLGATFTPCQNVHWYFDPTGLPMNMGLIKTDVAQSLAMLAAQTGLVFTEVASAAEAQLVVNGKNLQGLGSGVASMKPGSGTVTLGWDDAYLDDMFRGFDLLHLSYTDANGQPATLDTPGRGWLITRLLMVALGFWTVPDQTQLMHNAYTPAGAFGAGDLDGLHTMYLNQGCPAIPD